MNTKNWTIEKTIPTLAVPDLDAAIEFYEKLGFNVDWKWPENEATHAGLMLGECSIMVSLSEPDERGEIYFIVSDVMACHKYIMAAKPWKLAGKAGGLANRPDCPPSRANHPPNNPEERSYGLKDFSLIDPWGHCLIFGEVVNSKNSS